MICFIILIYFHRVKGEKPYECAVCNKKFAQHSQCKRHEVQHSGEKPYSCDLCDKAYFRKDKLDVHKLTHTGERPFPCELCNTSFYTKSKLDRHNKTAGHVKLLHEKMLRDGQDIDELKSETPE